MMVNLPFLCMGSVMKILVTGATGFIGRYLVQELSKTNSEIYCIVRKTSNISLLSDYGAKLICSDITDFNSLNESIDFLPDVIFHCAGYVANDSKEKLHLVNVLGTENICRFALEKKVKKVIYASSVSVVSGNKENPLTEDLPYSSTNIYGASKIQAEKKAIEYREKGLKVSILRPCMVYGRGEPHLLGKMLFFVKLRLFPILNGGTNHLHLVYVKNVVDVMLNAMNNDKLFEKTVFIADKEALTVKEVMNVMAKAIKAPPPFKINKKFVPFITNIPFVGKKISFFLKDRIYNIDRLKASGFQFRYEVRESLYDSCRKWR